MSHRFVLLGNLYLFLVLVIPLVATAGMPFTIADSHGHRANLHAPFLHAGELDTTGNVELAAEAYTFSLDLSGDSPPYPCTTTVLLRNRLDVPLNQLVLDAAGSTLAISGVLNVGTGTPIQHDHVNDELRLTHLLPADDTLSVRISYQLTPGTVQGPFGAMGLWFDGERGWTFSFPDGAHAWSPVIDNVAVKAPVTWRIGVDQPLTAVANGVLQNDWVDGAVHWFAYEEPSPVCTSEMGFCVAEYEIIEAQSEPFPIRYYVYPEDAADAAYDFQRVPQFVEMFEQFIGCDYPFGELKIVECGVFGGNGGQEHQTMISLGHNMITGSRTYEAIVMHEIAHQWFADYLTPVNWDHFWLNEGFAVYAEALWAEHLEGWTGYLDEIESDRSAYLAWSGSHGDALVNSNYDVTMNSPLPYERGATALHQLRSRYGEEAFRAAVASYLDAHANGHVASESLLEAFQDQTADPSLPGWFDEWVFRGEAPVIAWTEEITDQGQSVVHMRQLEDHYSSPEHGQLYDDFIVYFGAPGVQNPLSTPWPTGQADFSWYTGAASQTTWRPNPNLEVLARTEELPELDGPNLNIRMVTSAETLYPDRVLQPGEEMEVTFSVQNLGLPLESPMWQIANDPGCELIWEQTSGTLEDISYLQPDEEFITVTVTGGDNPAPHHERFALTIHDGQGLSSFTRDFRLRAGSAEILLISDGMSGVADSLGPVLHDVDIIWGHADVPISELPLDMYGAQAVMVEADARAAEHLFIDGDDNLRLWFNNGGSGSISGEYLHETYPTAHPNWIGGLGGEWAAPTTSPVFLGVEGDFMSQGRTIATLHPQANSICYPCCGNPPNFTTQGGVDASGWNDDGWRVMNYGFSLLHLANTDNIPMPRDELIQRTALWLLYRDMNHADSQQPAALPARFSLGAWPNPFNSQLQLRVELPVAGPLSVQVFNSLGRRVASLMDGSIVQAGTQELNWRAEGLASGVYFVRALHQSGSATQKVQLLR